MEESKKSLEITVDDDLTPEQLEEAKKISDRIDKMAEMERARRDKFIGTRFTDPKPKRNKRKKKATKASRRANRKKK